MMSKVYIQCFLLVIFVAASQQLPGARFRRQDDAANTTSTDKPAETSNGGATSPPSTGGGSFSGIIPRPSAESINNFMQQLTSENSPGSSLWQTAQPWINLFTNFGRPGGSQSGDTSKP